MHHNKVVVFVYHDMQELQNTISTWIMCLFIRRSSASVRKVFNVPEALDTLFSRWSVEDRNTYTVIILILMDL